MKVVPVSKSVPFPTIRAPTPLVFAILHERVQIVHFFIHDKKANLNKPVDGFLPIHYASAVGNYDILADILSTEDGIKQVNMPHKYLYTPLHMAVAHSHLKCVILLLKKGASPNFTSSYEPPITLNTPLHLCARLQDTKIAEALLAKKANLDFVNAKKETPINTCQAFNNQKMLEYLLKVKEDPSIVRDFSELCDEYLNDDRKKMSEEIEQLKKLLEKNGIKSEDK